MNNPPTVYRFLYMEISQPQPVTAVSRLAASTEVFPALGTEHDVTFFCCSIHYVKHCGH